MPAWERRLERVPHPLPEQGPVGQAGEPVVEGQVLQLADHGGQAAVEGLVVDHGEQLAADDQQHQDDEGPVRNGPLAWPRSCRVTETATARARARGQ